MGKIQAILAIVALTFVTSAQAQDAADVVYQNGKIYTVNEAQPWVEAVAIKDGRFVAVGSNADVDAVTGEGTEVNDLGGKFVMPGIHDTHVHPPFPYTPEEAGELDFPESLSKDEVIDVVKKFAAENPDVKIIRASKWSTLLFPGGKATKAWLDAALPDRAVMLLDESGHNVVASSKALELAGITKDTPDPDFGKIDRDPKTGEPTGYLSETAIGLIGKLVERPGVEENYRGITRSLQQIRAYGTTSIVDMAVGPAAIEAYLRLEREGNLDVRVNAAIALNDYSAEFTTLEESEALLRKRGELTTHLIDISMKYWADGTPFSHTSLLLEPYTDKPETTGEMTLGKKQLDRIVAGHKDGLQVRLHSVGDGTTHELLNVIEKAQKESPKPNLRHHLGHLMLVGADDIPRFKELNVIAEFSPVLWYPAPLTLTAENYVGKERLARWMPIKEFVNAGVTVTFGSDWPAGTPDADPWRGLEAMITRMDPHGDGSGYDVYGSSGKIGEGIELEDGIKILTLNGAMAMMHEDETGSIETGKYADMIILDRNLFEIEETEISEVRVLSTVFQGEEVYQAP